MDDINFKGYMKAENDKTKSKNKAYKSILHIINKEISEALHYSDSVICDIPAIMIEVPEYNPLEAMNYVTKKLLENKTFKLILVDLKVLHPLRLYFKWNKSLLT